jgi:hypothetical protein
MEQLLNGNQPSQNFNSNQRDLHQVSQRLALDSGDDITIRFEGGDESSRLNEI